MSARERGSGLPAKRNRRFLLVLATLLLSLSGVGVSSAAPPDDRPPGDPPPERFVCNDHIDNDGDGKVDFRGQSGKGDPDCTSPTDSSESADPPPTASPCSDGADNDGDGLIDANDPGCSSPSDPSELGTVQCDDGIDNDDDGLTDSRPSSGDPECSSPTDDDESGPVQPQADVSVTLVDDVDPQLAGRFVNYTLTVANAGPEAAQGVEVVIPIPEGAGQINLGDTCQPDFSRLRCPMGDVAAGGSRTTTFMVHYATPGTYEWTPTATATSPTDPSPANNTTTQTTTIAEA